MAILTERLHAGLTGLRQHIERASVRSRLLERSNRILEDMGLSRERLEAGVSAWPWRREPEDSMPSAMLGRASGKPLRFARNDARSGSADAHHEQAAA